MKEIKKKSNKILLIVAYSEKTLGTRYIANYLKNNGYDPTIIFFKEFDTLFKSIYITNKELSLLRELIQKEDYLFVGLNIHSSFILSEIKEMVDILRTELEVPFIIGGVYPTLEPIKCADKCDIVVRGDGEVALLSLANAIKNNQPWENIPNLSYYNSNDKYIENKMGPLIKDLDSIGYPLIGGKMYVIENDEIKEGDPNLVTDVYELTCMRGCPFRCFYCCSSKLYAEKGETTQVRVRSVANVIKELKEIKEKNKNIKIIHFWDEVFNTNKEWIKEFTEQYKKEIGIPFNIWGHPLLIKDEIIGMLKDAGLNMIGMGVQSGSPNVRNNIFKRPESNEQIIKASKILAKHKIPKVYYDLMICHPLETLEELKETFYLCLELEPPFELQIHGLAYMPGSDILNTIVERGIYTKEELEDMFKAPFDEQHTRFMGPIKGYFSGDERNEIWADLIYLTQFSDIREKVINLSKKPYKNAEAIRSLKREKNTIETHQYIPESSYEKVYIKNKSNKLKKLKNYFKKFLNIKNKGN